MQGPSHGMTAQGEAFARANTALNAVIRSRESRNPREIHYPPDCSVHPKRFNGRCVLHGKSSADVMVTATTIMNTIVQMYRRFWQFRGLEHRQKKKKHTPEMRAALKYKRTTDAIKASGQLVRSDFRGGLEVHLECFRKYSLQGRSAIRLSI